MNQEPTKGYIVVASRSKSFYDLAINLINSIKDWTLLGLSGNYNFFITKIFFNKKASEINRRLFHSQTIFNNQNI
jgi:hypothetical protein